MAYDSERIITLGELERRGKTVRFGIKEKDRSRHVYVIGQTGTGKSTLLEMMAMQDIRNGTGLIFMDPHGQSVEALLRYVTQEYLDRIIYFAPHHQEKPIGLNIMEDIGYDKRHLVVSSLMASFEKIWGAESWSDRMAYILANTLLALIEYPGTTLLDVGRMYTSKDFREKVVANLKDPQVRKYWVEEFANYTERYAQEATPSIQNKLGQFTSNPLMRNIIGQKKSAFNFREIMDEGKILLVNLSKGQIGENNARMLGVLFTTKIYLAALSRGDMTRAELEEANPCNFFVDEFQSFANSSFSDILSEARKYRLNLVMAHQYLGQLYTDDSSSGNAVRDAVFGNVGTFVSFRVGPVDAEVISKQFAPEVAEEDLVALPRYHIYLTLNIDGAGSTPFSARTFYEPPPGGETLEDTVVQRTMDTYGVDREVIEKIVADNLAEDAEKNEGAKKGGGNKQWAQGGRRDGGGRGDGKGGGKGGGQDSRKESGTHTPLKGLVGQIMQRQSAPAKEKREEKPDRRSAAREAREKEDSARPRARVVDAGSERKGDSAELRTHAVDAGSEKQDDFVKPHTRAVGADGERKGDSAKSRARAVDADDEKRQERDAEKQDEVSDAAPPKIERRQRDQSVGENGGREAGRRERHQFGGNRDERNSGRQRDRAASRDDAGARERRNTRQNRSGAPHDAEKQNRRDENGRQRLTDRRDGGSGDGQRDGKMHTPLKGLVEQAQQSAEPVRGRGQKDERSADKKSTARQTQKKDFAERVRTPAPDVKTDVGADDHAAVVRRSDSPRNRAADRRRDDPSRDRVSARDTDRRRDDSSRDRASARDTNRRHDDSPRNRAPARDTNRRHDDSPRNRAPVRGADRQQKDGDSSFARQEKTEDARKNQQQDQRREISSQDTRQRQDTQKQKPSDVQADKRQDKEAGTSSDTQVARGTVSRTVVRQPEQEKVPRPVGTVRRPSGVVAGSISRSAAAQPQNTEPSNIRSAPAASSESGVTVVTGGLGDLVKITKSSGLRKDLKVAPKKEEKAPPINYEEGWVSIGDLGRLSED